jgi:[acyl-carrier-protein] S-malonyltransferase
MVSAAARIALVFPGQGSQTVGMGKAARDAWPGARDVFDRADRALGFALGRLCFEGPEETLRLTANTQPAILATSLAVLTAVRDSLGTAWGERVACAAGHSLGEYTALVAAGALDFEDAIRTVRKRGEYMQEAVPAGEGAMAAVLGLTLQEVEALCLAAAEGECLAPANLNAPEQIVVAGTATAVARLGPLAKARGARRVLPLPVSAPFHCALMAPAQDRLEKHLGSVPFKDAAFPVIANATSQPERRAGEFRKLLVRQVTAPVRWVETVERIKALGVTVILEVGPGRVLSGLAKRIAPDLACFSVEDPQSLAAALEALGTGATGMPR